MLHYLTFISSLHLNFFLQTTILNTCERHHIPTFEFFRTRRQCNDYSHRQYASEYQWRYDSNQRVRYRGHERHRTRSAKKCQCLSYENRLRLGSSHLRMYSHTFPRIWRLILMPTILRYPTVHRKQTTILTLTFAYLNQPIHQPWTDSQHTSHLSIRRLGIWTAILI